jgi:hypothetical protein
MATYIPGMTDYIPQIQPFVPDYNFLSNVLQTKQSKYDTAHKQISSLYGSILNAPLSREDNITKRDELFKQIDGQIKQISGLDLSLQQNQDYAATIFDPITDDEHIRKDMQWTREYQGQVNRGEGFKMCTDPKTCGGQYWDGGMQLLQYKRKEFMEADPTKALTMANPTYVPKVDVVADTMKELTAMKLQVKVDSISGGYIITDTNGKNMIGTLKDYLTAKYGTDQKVQDFYRAQGELNRRNFTAQHTEEYGSEQAALQAYYRELFPKMTEEVKNGKQQADKNYKNVNELKSAYEASLKTDGVTPKDKSVFDEWQEITKAHDAASASKGIHEKREDVLKNAEINIGDSDIFGARLDDMLGSAMLDKALLNAATSYAMLTTEHEMKADPYGLESMRESFEMKKMQMEKGWMAPDAEGNLVYHEGLDVAAWKAKEDYKQKQNMVKMAALLGGGRGVTGGLINATVDTNVLGMATGDEQKRLLALTENKQGMLNVFNALQGDQKAFISSVTNSLIERSKTDTKLVPVLKGMLVNTGISAEKLLAGDPKTLQQLNDMSLETSSRIYNFITTNMDPSKDGVYNRLSKGWANENWASYSKDRALITRAHNDITDFTKGIKAENINTAKAVAGYFLGNPGIDPDDIADPNSNNTSVAYGKSFVPVQDKIQQNKYKAELAEFLISNSPTGLMPTGTIKEKLVRKWADSHKDFKPMYNPKAEYVAFKGSAMSQYNNAYEFGMDNVGDIEAKFNEMYPTKTKSWKQFEGGMGDLSTGKMTAAIKFPINWKAGNIANNQTILSTMDNWMKLPEAERLAKFGDANMYEGFDDEAKMIGSALYDSMQKAYDAKAKGAPSGDVTMQRIAFADAGKTAFTVRLSKDYVEENLLSTTPLKDKAALLQKYTQPITFVIPADKADNEFYKNTDVKLTDWQLAHGGLKVTEFPGGGDVKIVKTETGHLITGQVKWIDAADVEHIENIYENKPYTDGLNGEVLQDYYTDWLNRLEQANIAQRAGNQKRLAVTGTPEEIREKLKGQ